MFHINLQDYNEILNFMLKARHSLDKSSSSLFCFVLFSTTNLEIALTSRTEENILVRERLLVSAYIQLPFKCQLQNISREQNLFIQNVLQLSFHNITKLVKCCTKTTHKHPFLSLNLCFFFQSGRGLKRYIPVCMPCI